MGMLTGAAAMENSTVVPFKTKNRATIRSTNPTPEHILNRTIIQKAACTPVFIYTIYNSQDMETNPMFIDRDMDEEDVVHMYNGILFSH